MREPTRIVRSARGPSRVDGFTLVELLVVIGIIALLISILLPALSKARESANQLKCSAQQRQIVMGMILHANDHRGFMPLAGYLWTEGQGTDPKSVLDFKRERYEYVGTTALQVAATGAAIGKYLGQDMDFTSVPALEATMAKGLVRKIFICPSDRQGGRFGRTVGNGGSYWSSYGFNEGPLGWADSTGSNQGGVYGHSRLRGNTARFPHASQLMLLSDAKPRGPTATEDPNSWMLFNDSDVDATLGDWYDGVINKNPHKNTGDPTLVDLNRHNKRMIVAFADGHVENLMMDEGTLSKVSVTLDFGNAR
jgi:prepilin-type N-terminal cleavage/methylation domain-containing protein/prepilin-type processing-associated H-X9-DG protein